MSEYLAPPLETSPAALLKVFEEYMEANVPGWENAPGNLDSRLAGAFAQLVAQLNEAASEGATNTLRYFGANIVGIKPTESVQATGLATFTAIDELGHTVPTGTVVVWLTSKGNRVAFETIEEAVIPVGKKEVSGITVRAVLGGSEANELQGAATELVTALPFVSSVTLQAATTGGVEEETDASYLAKLVQEFRLLTPKPILASDFSLDLLNMSGVGRATTLAGFNSTATLVVTGKIKNTGTATEKKTITLLTEGQTEQLMVGSSVTGSGIPANSVIIEVLKTSVVMNNEATKEENSSLTFTGTLKNGGYITSIVGTSEGEPLTATREKELEAKVQAECLVGVTYKIIKAKYTPINVEATVFAWPEQNTATIKAAVEAAIRNYLSPKLWGKPPQGGAEGAWFNEPHVRLVNVEHAILSVVGTHYVASLKLNEKAEDLLMTGFVPLPFAGSSLLAGKLTAASKTITGLSSTEKITVGTEVSGFIAQIKDKAKLTEKSKILTGVAEATCKELVVGQEVTGTGIPGGAKITEILTSKKEVVLSLEATETKENELTFLGVKNSVAEVKSATEVKVKNEASKTEEPTITFTIPVIVTVETG